MLSEDVFFMENEIFGHQECDDKVKNFDYIKIVIFDFFYEGKSISSPEI